MSDDGIKWNERTLILGHTGSGKSVLLNHLVSGIKCQRVIVDTKREWNVAGVEPISDVAAIDWRAPVIHYRTSAVGDELGELDRLFQACYSRRHLVVAVHELEDLCDYHPQKTPPYVKAYLSKGRAHGLGLLGAAQRPLEIPKRARTEAQHYFILVPPPDDIEECAKLVGLAPPELVSELEEAQQALGEHAFLWYSRNTRELRACRPLSAALCSRSIASRASVA